LISSIAKDPNIKFKFSEEYDLPEKKNLEMLNKIFNKEFNLESETIDYVVNKCFG